MTANRPATEPRTEAGRRLAEADAQALWSPAEVRAAILAIEAEAASPAALDVPAITAILDEHQFIDARGGHCTCDDWTGDPPERYHNDHVARILAARLTEQEQSR